ncbi:hypothetical protein CROQUDRAFT_665191 [Cronartium quercuum f. sp. fusiforme G11]|uniref:Vacuolar protein-sorting-associated protein 36 n=1 Tax=Cronartium quercuum f. sp. fusiforme G11 TaxID=708437 RepID=A0A9P6N9Y5_9BASI|nr:hypothetical protein CROQUDRAFT_665191 [Cronartium quercuum f. sp. fusiforme G11]
MHRLRSIDTSSQTIRKQLLPHERILEHQLGVGIYDGKEKDEGRSDGEIILSSHRLIYIDTIKPQQQSCALELRLIRQTEYWSGFLKSSPKITLLLGESTEGDEIVEEMEIDEWNCTVCGHSNFKGIYKCDLCGVPKPIMREQHESKLSISSSQSNQNISDGSLKDEDDEITCSACTFLNHSSMKRCEICDTILQQRPSTIRNLSSLTLQHSRASTPAPPSGFPSNAYIRLSFRRGGVETFYNSLKTALQMKAWTTSQNLSRQRAIGGIEGILRSMDSKLLAEQSEMNEGLKDLQALMTKAKDMVQMAQSLNSKLSALEVSTGKIKSNDEETIIRSSLLKLGLPTPAVTSDMLKSEEIYLIELTKELLSVLREGKVFGGNSSEIKGIVSLDQIWCIWNRARGVALVSPTDLLSVCERLPTFTENQEICLSTFRSGLKVLHTSHYKPEIFGARLQSAFELERVGLTTVEIAQAETLSVSLTYELIELVEIRSGDIVRDGDSKSALKWWPNLINQYQWPDVNNS